MSDAPVAGTEFYTSELFKVGVFSEEEMLEKARVEAERVFARTATARLGPGQKFGEVKMIWIGRNHVDYDEEEEMPVFFHSIVHCAVVENA